MIDIPPLLRGDGVRAPLIRSSKFNVRVAEDHIGSARMSLAG
jgi:hypothetical protein